MQKEQTNEEIEPELEKIVVISIYKQKGQLNYHLGEEVTIEEVYGAVSLVKKEIEENFTVSGI